MLDALIARMAEGTALGPLLGFLAGALLGVSPVALPSVPAVMSVVSPGRVLADGQRVRLPWYRVVPVVVAFVIGMDGVLGVAGYLFVEVTVALTRAAVVLNLFAAILLGALGLRLLFRRSSLCRRARAIPLRPHEALGFGMVFAVTGCPGCGPIAIGVGAAAALVGGPVYALAVIGAFVLGRAAVLLATAAVGARLIPTGDDIRWARLDLAVGVLFVAAAGFYLYRLLNGDVTTALPGEPGGGLP